ncbi:hypothetical protein DZF91_30450 [Actinomadura logoneensis]|uniref:Uncharacterized protein n=1 Tax=Actinomadura logoneensis TaxID=2293572 RepID=A0A372JD26_9ACTN|nr:hypothetical protein [Actinomadura logoneensis]RFU37913.1 hypothetical protein DZF91_30450 [Actinomadura logoneensis]
MHDHITYAAGRLGTAGSLPDLLAAAFDGLELVERAATVLADPSRGPVRPGLDTALSEASQACWALATAPTVQSAEAGPPARTLGIRETVETLSRFCLQLTEALVAATAHTLDPADRIACLRAARHIARAHVVLI